MNAKKLLRLLVLFLALFIGSVAQSADLQKGTDAAEKGDFVTALRELKPLAEQGDARAQFVLGGMHTTGQGVAQNDKEAARWFRMAAEQGVADAQLLLGLLHYEGWGVAQNYTEALKWYRLAAKQRVVEAQFNLGEMHRKGEGVAQNKALAYMWMNLAAANGDKEATEARALLEKKMTSAQIEKAKKRVGEYVEKNYQGC